MSFIGSLVNAITGSNASRTAASQETTASYNAAAINDRVYNQLQNWADPYIGWGNWANRMLQSQLSDQSISAPFQMTQAQLEQAPGYQFQLQQGLQATQNAAAARGLGVSGAALKGAATYAQGLASSNYQQAFQDYWANQNNRYQMLSGLANQGINAMGAVSGAMTAATQAQAGNVAAAGQQTAAGTLGSQAAYAQGLSNITGAQMAQTASGGSTQSQPQTFSQYGNQLLGPFAQFFQGGATTSGA